MSKKKRKKRKQKNNYTQSPARMMWAEDDGIHTLIPGRQPSSADLEVISLNFQQNIRNSPIWKEMVNEFGKEKAEELLKQCRAELC